MEKKLFCFVRSLPQNMKHTVFSNKTQFVISKLGSQSCLLPSFTKGILGL